MHYQRKTKGKTDYRLRLNLLKSGKPRLVVRRFNKALTIQVITYEADGDRILLGVHSCVLSKQFAWKYSGKNLPAAYLLGLYAGKKALAAGVTDAILDHGLFRVRIGTKFFAVLKGILDAGVKVPHNPIMLPSKERLLGKHILTYYQAHKEKFKKIDITSLEKDLETVKQKILKS